MNSKKKLTNRQRFQLLVKKHQQSNPRLDSVEMPQKKDEDDGSGFLRELRQFDEQINEAIKSYRQSNK